MEGRKYNCRGKYNCRKDSSSLGKRKMANYRVDRVDQVDLIVSFLGVFG